DDAGRPDLAQQAIEGADLVGSRPAWIDGERQVGALESRHDLQRIRQVKLPGEVGADLRRRGGGERGDGNSELLPEAAEPAVVRPEVMPPLADAVRLVHHKPRNPDAGQAGAERAAREPLRCYVHKPEPPGAQTGLHSGALGRSE